MKYIILFLTFVFACNMKAQYFDTTLKYRVVNTHWDGGNFGFYDYYYSISLDSISNDTQYYHLRHLDSKKKVCLVKYHNGKVWSFNLKFQNIYKYRLFYDFNKSVGDSIDIAKSDFSANFTRIDSVKTIQLNNRNYRAQFLNGGIIFVDSLGCLNNGLVYDFYLFEEISELIMLCKQEQLLYWQDHPVVKSGQNTCNPIFYKANIQNNAYKTFEIYPNPSSHSFTLNFDQTTNTTYSIYNTYGQLVKTQIIQTQQTEVDICDLNDGIYTLVVKQPNKQYSKKLIVLKD